VLVVKGIDYDRTKFTKVDIYVNSPDNVVKSGSAEFAGSFVNVAHKPHNASGKKPYKSNLKLGLTDLLDDIKADDDDDIIVTLVPRRGRVKVDGVAIEFLTEDL
jgi:polyphenol oxidase